MHSRFRRRSRESGYMLIVIMFMMVLMVIAMLAAAPAVKAELQRDREEEMIHRGAQYARAIKKFYKKFGRYPSSLDELEKTNNLRFLRKRYKDPMTADGKWKLLHVGDVKLGSTSNIGTPVSAMGTLGGPSGNLGTPAASAFGSPSPQSSNQSAFGNSLGGNAGTLGALAGGLGSN